MHAQSRGCSLVALPGQFLFACCHPGGHREWTNWTRNPLPLGLPASSRLPWRQTQPGPEARLDHQCRQTLAGFRVAICPGVCGKLGEGWVIAQARSCLPQSAPPSPGQSVPHEGTQRGKLSFLHLMYHFQGHGNDCRTNQACRTPATSRPPRMGPFSQRLTPSSNSANRYRLSPFSVGPGEVRVTCATHSFLVTSMNSTGRLRLSVQSLLLPWSRGHHFQGDCQFPSPRP